MIQKMLMLEDKELMFERENLRDKTWILDYSGSYVFILKAPRVSRIAPCKNFMFEHFLISFVRLSDVACPLGMNVTFIYCTYIYALSDEWHTETEHGEIRRIQVHE